MLKALPKWYWHRGAIFCSLKGTPAGAPSVVIQHKEADRLIRLATKTPQPLPLPAKQDQRQKPGDPRYWFYKDRFYAADADLSAEDVRALAEEQGNKKRLKLQRAHALQAMTEQLDSKAKRQPIPQDIKVLVWQRDGGRCTSCGSQNELEYDHIIPLALNGSNSDRNLQLLCADCNRRKGPTLG